MLTLMDKVLVIVLLHSFKSTSQTSTLLYPSTYWQTTYVSDRVPDYWNHGIYAPKLLKSEKEDIFPAWLIKTTTESSSQITETRDIDKEAETLKADLAADTTMPKTDWSELNSTVPSVITRTAETKSNSIMINSIVATTPPTPEKNDFTHPEHETTIDDYDDGEDDPFLITMTPSVKTTTSESILNSIIAESTFITAPTKSAKRDFTRPEFETSLDDNDGDNNSSLIIVNTSTITSPEKSISDSIITDIYITTTPKSKKESFTRPEYETTINDEDAPPLTLMNPNLIVTVEETQSNSITTDSILTTTAPATEYDTPVDDDAHPISTTMTLTSTTPYQTTFDYAAHPNSTKMNQRTSSPEYNTFFYYDANLNKPQKSLTLEFDTTALGDESQPTSTTMTLSSSNTYETTLHYATSSSTRMTQQTSTPEYDTTVHDFGAQPDAVSMTQSSPTTPDHHTQNYDNEANYMSMMMTLPSISYESKFAVHPKRARITRRIQKYSHGPTMYARTKRTKKKLSKTTSQTDPVKVMRAVNKEVGTDQFSVFLRKLLIVLSVKRLEDLPLLINQFKEYLWMLMTDGKLGNLGLDINSFLAQQVMVLDNWPVKPIREFFDTLQKKLGNRNRELPKDLNDILDYMDDTYDEAEEEAMQAVLHEASLFPNTKHYNKIAQGFVDYVFLHPMQRVMGTTRGNILFGMITDAVKLRDPFKEEHKIRLNQDLRKNLHFGKIPKHLRQLSDIKSDESLVNKSNKRKLDDSEDESDSNSDNDNLSDNSKKIKSPDGVNEHEHSGETEGSKETTESKYYGYKNNVVTRNGIFTNDNKVRKSFRKMRTLRYLMNENKSKLRTLDSNKEIPQHLKFQQVRKSFSKMRTLRYLMNENKTKLRTLDSNKEIPQHLKFQQVRKSFSKMRTLRYLMNENKTKLRTLDNNEEIPQHLPRKHSRQTTANRAYFHETTDSSNIEMELKAKIYETFRRMNLVNKNPSRRMRQGIKSTISVKDDSYEETDVERVLKKNIYKAVKKLLN